MVPFLMEDLGRMKALVRQAHRMVVDSLLQYAIVQWCLPPNGGASLPQVQRGLRSHRLLLLSLQAFLGILASSLKGDSARMQCVSSLPYLYIAFGICLFCGGWMMEGSVLMALEFPSLVQDGGHQAASVSARAILFSL